MHSHIVLKLIKYSKLMYLCYDTPSSSSMPFNCSHCKPNNYSIIYIIIIIYIYIHIHIIIVVNSLLDKRVHMESNREVYFHLMGGINAFINSKVIILDVYLIISNDDSRRRRRRTRRC